jgi:putative Mn2+ efflux pump MntP
MGILELLFLAVGLSMDACAVSICKGLAMRKATLKEGAICGTWFGGFQALMPLIGFFLGSLFAHAIEAADHWIALALLAFIGINMLKEAFSKEEECEECSGADLSFKTMLVMAIATSIDALAVGISLAMAGDVNIFTAVALIGIVSAASFAILLSTRFGHWILPQPRESRVSDFLPFQKLMSDGVTILCRNN